MFFTLLMPLHILIIEIHLRLTYIEIEIRFYRCMFGSFIFGTDYSSTLLNIYLLLSLLKEPSNIQVNEI